MSTVCRIGPEARAWGIACSSGLRQSGAESQVSLGWSVLVPLDKVYSQWKGEHCSQSPLI